MSKKEGVFVSKKNRKNHTQKQMLESIMNNPLLYDDADACKKILVAYYHEKTDHMNQDEKYDYALKNIFPLRKKIDKYVELDKLNNPLISATYFRLKSELVNSASDYFCLIALVEILLITNDARINCTDEELFELAVTFAFNTNITKNAINEELFNIREEIKKQKTK